MLRNLWIALARPPLQSGVPHAITRRLGLAAQLVGWPTLALVAAARWSRSWRPWLLELVDTWQLYLLSPWPALAPLALWLRSPALGVLATAGGALGLIHGRAVLGRARSAPGGPGARLRVMTANVLGDNAAVDGLIELIQREQPDVVALQEVRPAFAEAVLARLGTAYPYRQLHPDARYAGAALLSRVPFEEPLQFKLCERGHHCQQVRLLLDDQPLRFFNIHLQVPFEIVARPRRFPPFWIRWRSDNARAEEVERLLRLLEPIAEPVIVVGDFNTAAGSWVHRRLLEHLRDAFQEAGRGFGHTFPRPVSVNGLVLPCPVLRIDYVFFRGALQPVAARTLEQRGSDHRALVVDFLLPALAHRDGRVSRNGHARIDGRRSATLDAAPDPLAEPR